LLDEYAARSTSEQIQVSELAHLYWKKRRLEARAREVLNKRRAPSEANDSNGLDIIANDIRASAKSHSQAAQFVCDLIVKHLERVLNDKDVTADSVGREFEKLTELAKELNICSKELVLPLLQAAEKWKLDEIERAYDPDIMERELKIQAEIDRRIEKVLKQLVLIKEYKKYYVAKGIDSQPLAIEVLPAK
jgi:hypothetical protein